MKTAIVFSSTHGTTEKASQLLGEHIKGDVEIIDLRKCPNPSLEEYNSVILGSSIHAGSGQSRVNQFIKKHQSVLITKQIGLFLCCMYEGDQAVKQFETAYPEELREISVANGLFGGEFIFSKMNFLERQIVKKVSGITNDVSKLDVNEIKKFADKFNANT
ncbi:flavodoxin [Clostridiales bacterium PH28_bin88]|nr:flavodoxin [Clostridiales bacterium PH28_bin88]